MTFPDLLRAHPILRGALIAPSVVALVFVLFNLTSAVDPAKATAAISVAVVNQDDGVTVPAGTLRLSAPIVAGLAANLPFHVFEVTDEATATLGLDHGFIAAAIVFPADFTRAVVEGRAVTVRVLNSDHLSVFETQVGNTLPGQLQSALTIAVTGARAALGTAPPPPAPAAGPAAPPPLIAPPVPAPVPRADVAVGPRPPAVPVPPVVVRDLPDLTPGAVAAVDPPSPAPGTTTAARAPAPILVAVTKLHAAPNYVALQAPFVLSFASWMSGMIGGALLFFGTRAALNQATIGPVAFARIFIPLVAAGFASLVAIALTAWLAVGWSNFAELFAYRWLLNAGIAMWIIAAFSVLGFLGFLVTVPLVFYQATLGGALAPVAAAPGWLTWLNDAVPLPALMTGLRTLLIGGPAGSIPWGPAALALAIAIVVTWTATVLRGRMIRR